ncbi:MAG: glycosyltransferase family 2 protein [Caldilineales bacterium]|nr:glycosyltransferase family 2 protein [Caldilineales bacterium]
MASPVVSILIVSWNVRDYLLRCLASLAAGADGLSYEVIVVDNASRDGTVAAVQAQFPAVRVMANATNRGFTAGNNQALAVARGAFFFLLNPDTEVQPDAIAELHRFLVAHPDVGIVGPRLLYPDGSLQSSRRRFPTLATLFTESTVVQEYLPGLAVFRRYTLADVSPDRPQPVDWVVGAAMLVRREVYEQIGGLDEGFFMYAEEMDWCRRAQAAGWKVAYDPAAVVIHHEARSSEQVAAARLIYFFGSRVRYARKYFGAGWAEALRLWLLVTFVWQWLREAGKWLVGHKRSLRAARMAAYAQVLRSGLR